MLPQLCQNPETIISVYVSVFCCLLRQLPWQGENEHRSTRYRWRNVQGWSICPSIPRLVFPYLIYVCSRYWSLDTAAAPSVWRQNGRRVNHCGYPAWRQVESAAYVVDASWCNEHNGDGQLQRNMAAFSLDSVAVDSNHIIVLPSWTGVPAWLEWWNSILV